MIIYNLIQEQIMKNKLREEKQRNIKLAAQAFDILKTLPKPVIDLVRELLNEHYRTNNDES